MFWWFVLSLFLAYVTRVLFFGLLVAGPNSVISRRMSQVIKLGGQLLQYISLASGQCDQLIPLKIYLAT